MQFAPGILAAIISAKSHLKTRAGENYIDVFNSADEHVDRIVFDRGQVVWGSLDEYKMPVKNVKQVVDAIIYSLKDVT